MPRVKRGVQANKRRKNLLKHAKGFTWGRSTKYRAAKEALLHAWSFQFKSRRKKKGDFRRIWQIKIGAGAKLNGLSYSKFINGLKKSHIDLDRKILSDLAANQPEVFSKIVEAAQKSLS
ncbi:MAG TPA: 50S ribosomal protein L20 [Candidatus Paceibacterota bacterium]